MIPQTALLARKRCKQLPILHVYVGIAVAPVRRSRAMYPRQLPLVIRSALYDACALSIHFVDPTRRVLRGDNYFQRRAWMQNGIHLSKTDLSRTLLQSGEL